MAYETEVWPLNVDEIKRCANVAEGEGRRLVTLIPVSGSSAAVIALLQVEED